MIIFSSILLFLVSPRELTAHRRQNIRGENMNKELTKKFLSALVEDRFPLINGAYKKREDEILSLLDRGDTNSIYDILHMDEWEILFITEWNSKTEEWMQGNINLKKWAELNRVRIHKVISIFLDEGPSALPVELVKGMSDWDQNVKEHDPIDVSQVIMNLYREDIDGEYGKEADALIKIMEILCRDLPQWVNPK